MNSKFFYFLTILIASSNAIQLKNAKAIDAESTGVVPPPPGVCNDWPEKKFVANPRG
jgi:hypothetical protein